MACEFSGVVRDAFLAKGHDAWSCDLIPSESKRRKHLELDVREILADGWDLLIAHPPCIYLANSGNKHLWDDMKRVNGPNLQRWEDMRAGAQFFNTLKGANIPRICIENPIMGKWAKALIGPQTQVIQPWMFGHGETKATCLWLKNLPKLVATDIVEGRVARVHKEPPGPNRWKNRSRTYTGVAAAMAEQWG